MAIRQLAIELALSPDELELVVAAYNEVRSQLELDGNDYPLTRAVAIAVLDVFREGERDPERIVETVIDSFGKRAWPK